MEFDDMFDYSDNSIDEMLNAKLNNIRFNVQDKFDDELPNFDNCP